MGKKGSYIGGSTVVRVYQSEKRLKERQAHWRRKRGIDRIDQCLEGIGDAAEPTRVIKAGDARLRPHRVKRRKRSAEQSDTDSNAVGLDRAAKKGKIRVWRAEPSSP
ncbi:hypothetical protein [Bradyrhizobium elkanii]|uniref:hypothetical protein n=1 Tax=Bradyrhizobium elkanii TaxID=29448 RepID=UPI00084213D7|nr:hypothetical protein [Bradyrhizobium elkanii]ODM70506.1 hypothetical protein A6X20_07835 [Bradyrhizobium elkanii]ODM79942.1 hypothetical protein A6452_24300 [Bradyrhizobium elkanii]